MMNTANNRILEFIKSYDSGLILNTLIALQLIPENHGKNSRIEELSKMTVLNLNNGQSFEITNFLELLAKEYCSDIDDIPENLFCETVVFFEGNYTIFSGISSYSADILRNLTTSIFLLDNKLPKEFKERAYEGIMLILHLGQMMAKKANLEGNILGDHTGKDLKFANDNIDFSFSEIEIESILRCLNLKKNLINDFILSPTDERFETDNSDLNPLLFYPIIRHNDRYFFLLISNQCNALNEYLFRLSHQYECKEELLKSYHNLVWHELLNSFREMRWGMTSISLPKSNLNHKFREGVFQFDTNLLAYVLYIQGSNIEDLYSEEAPKVISHVELNERLKNVSEYFRGDKQFKSCRFLFLITHDNLGRNFAIGISGSSGDEVRISFSAAQLIQLAQTEKWNTHGLWKFAKVHEKFRESTQSFSDTLDLYSIYKEYGYSFYTSDEFRPSMLVIDPGYGSKLIKEGKLKSDYHGVLIRSTDSIAHVPVKKRANFAPIYEPKQSLGYFAICLKSYHFPIWFVNKQSSVHKNNRLVPLFAEAIAFWLYKLHPSIEKVVSNHKTTVLEIEIILDENMLTDVSFNRKISSSFTLGTYTFSCQNQNIKFKIPSDVLDSLTGAKNEGERTLIKAVLSSLNFLEGISIPESKINDILNEIMPVGNAKMILISDNLTDLVIDDRWLRSPLYLSEAETQMINDELPKLIEHLMEISEMLESPDEKVKLLNTATKVLLEKLQEEIDQFDYHSLLNELILLYEALLHTGKYNATLVPAQINCFGHDQDKLREIAINEKSIVVSSLAIRCLIEYIAAKPTPGKCHASDDQIDRLMALMYEIINYGFMSDIIHFRMDDPEIGKLKSGRIGFSKDFYEEKLMPFAKAHIEETVDDYLENFESRFAKRNYSNIEIGEAVVNELDSINAAFLNDWGIEYDDIFKFCQLCALICINNQASVITIKETDFIQKMCNEFKFPDNRIEAALRKFVLTQREEYLIAPDGFKNQEVFPWKYNREFSYNRRFIIRHNNKAGDVLLTWGFRTAVTSEQQLSLLLNSGRLNNGGEEINKLLGIFNERKGKTHRNLVRDYLKTLTELTVIDYEVDISPKGALIADKKYGDIDILVFDPQTKTAFSIECKSTSKAKNIHEMKTELDNYLGKNGKVGMIDKHVLRHQWLQNNKNKLKKFLKTDLDLSIRSIIITSEVIPITFIKSSFLPIPILSIFELKKGAISSLRNAHLKSFEK